MTKTEERILKVWQEVFGREDFGIDDDFFELGGNSLMAMRIYMKLSEEVAGLEIDDFFESLCSCDCKKSRWKNRTMIKSNIYNYENISIKVRRIL